MAGNDSSSARSLELPELDDYAVLCARLLGTVAEHVSDPQRVGADIEAYYGERAGLHLLLAIIDQHLNAPQIEEQDDSTHSEVVVPGVGLIQLSCWPADYFAEGEGPYLALMYAETPKLPS